MKKIGLSVLAAVLTMSLNAQSNAPRELNCTEEVVTFKASFGSGWHFSKLVFTQQRIPTVTADFTMRGLYLLKAATPKIPEQQTFESPLSRFSFWRPIDSILPNNPLFREFFDFKTKNLSNYTLISVGSGCHTFLRNIFKIATGCSSAPNGKSN